MSKNYKQLSLEQRYQIEALKKAGIKKNRIASQLGVHPSTITRELKRNIAQRGRTAGEYLAMNAERKTQQRHQQKAKQICFTEVLKKQVTQELLADKWSPELIRGNAWRENRFMVSHETIYKWIWACKHGNKRKDADYKQLYQALKHGKRKRKRGNRKDSRGLIPNRTGIDMRPKIVAKRKRLGDVEVDLMMGKNHKGALLVMTDRASLHTRLKKLLTKNSKKVANGVIRELSKYKHTIHTLTFDNDKAFSDHERICKELSVKSYFTRPYTSQDKGTVENRIGVIRRFFPKKTDICSVSVKEVRRTEAKINNRPIRKFKYLNANQVLLKKIALMT